MDQKHNYSTIICGNCGRRHEIPDNCGNRFCPICSGPRRRRAKSKMDAIIAATHARPGERWRHIVLTLPSQDDLKAQVTALLHSFRRLRQRSWWKRHMRGGFFVIEITRGIAGWHAHAHILVLSGWVYASALGHHWSAVSTGRITKITLAPPGRLSRYLTSYITKTEINQEAQLIASYQLKGFRLFGTFGSINNPRIKVPPIPYLCDACEAAAWVHERSKHYVETIREFPYQAPRKRAG